MLGHLKKEKPTHVVQIGDLLDQYVFSRYSRSLEITPDQEVEDGIKYAKQMWLDIKKVVPRAKCHQLLGNHDVRMQKRIAEKLPELRNYVKNIYNFDGVATRSSDRDYLCIDTVVYVHGWLSKSIDHALYFNQSTVHGHSHRSGLSVNRPGLWSLDVGFMGDEKQLPMKYTMSKLTKWTLACGVVEDKQPRLIFL